MEKFPHSREHQSLLELLREAREGSGITQIELAERLGETQSFISKCERGERRLDLIELREWCRALDQSLVDILGRLERRIAQAKQRNP